MSEVSRESRLRLFAAATGLTVSEEAAPTGVPSPLNAMKSVAGWEIRPTAKVPLDHPDPLREADRLWFLHARRNGLFDEDGSFLVSIPGAMSLGWIVARFAPGAELAPRLAEPGHGLDFVAMSTDGRVVCAVNEEEYDFWIVVEHPAPTSEDQQVAPVPVGTRVNASLAKLIRAGARAVGAEYLRCKTAGAAESRLPLDTTYEGVRPPCVLSTPDRQGVVRFPRPGYALVEGTARFMAAAVPEGVDEARIRFARYARALAHRHPALTAVADAHPTAHRTWSRPADVESGSATARHLSLLTDFVSGTLPAAEFAQAWYQTRRVSRADGDRVRGDLATLLDHVFLTLEDYTWDPSLREPGDLTDTQLRDAISQITHTIQ
jgi:hypothetical protein